MEGIRLCDLADLALGTPVVGTVNFPALHTLLHAIIQHLHIQDVVVLRGSGSCQSSGDILVKEEPDGQEDRMSPRILHIEKQLETLNNIPCRLDMIERTKPGEQAGALEDMQKMMMQLSERLEVTEKEVYKENLQQISQEEPKELDLLKTCLKNLEDKMEVLCETLTRRPETQDAQTTYSLEPSNNDSSRISGPTQAAENVVSDGPILDASHTTLPQAQRSSEAEDSAHPVQTPHVTEDAITASTLEDTQIEVSGQRHETNLTYPETSTPQNTTINLSRTNMGTTAAPGSPGVTLAPPTGVTTNDHAMLYTRVDALERDKADRSELGLLQKNIDEIAKTVPNLKEKLISLDKEIQDQRSDRDKLNMLHGIPTTTASSSSTLPAVIIPKQSDSYTPVSTVSVETELPAQDTMQTKSPVTTTTSKDHLTSSAYTIDKGREESEVVSQYEHPQNMVTDYTSGEAASEEPREGKKTTGPYIQDSEVTDTIKNAMVQLQEEWEPLNKTTTSLIQDLEEIQQHTDIIYQADGKLENKKADKELIGLDVDVKMDERASGSKVSRTHFDATTEHLSRMVQELLGKVNAQGQDWQRLLEKINVEMQNKLDRIEIDSLKSSMEEHWQDLCRQLQEQPSQHEAAGIRKQIRFRCISCDHPVDMMTPGSPVLTIPNIPGLPAHHSNQPFSGPELSQVREQSHRLKSGIHHVKREASQLEKSIKHLCKIHAQMCQEIARVQLHFEHSSKIIRCHQQQHRTRTNPGYDQRPDHLPELQSVEYMSISRSCGGRHTLTFSQSDYTKLRANSPCSMQKKDTTGAGIKKEEVFILGKDNHMYRGRLDNRFSAFKPEDGERASSTNQRASGYSLKEKGNIAGFSSAASPDSCYGVSSVHVKSTYGSQQSLPSVKGSAAPTYSNIADSTQRASALSRTSPEFPSSASSGHLQQ